MIKNTYPENWPMIAYQVKDEAGWKCVRCGHAHDPKTGYTLTVHHLDGNKANCSKENIRALCQRCHLRAEKYCAAIAEGQINLFQKEGTQC